MLLYAAGLAACVAWERRRLPRLAAAALALAAGAWALAWALAARLDAPVGEALTDWQMHAGGSEELREALGLALVAGWSAVLARRPRPPP